MLPSAWISAKRALVAPTSPIRPTLIEQPPARANLRHHWIQILVFAGVMPPTAAIADPIMALNRPPKPLDNVASGISMGRQLRCREIWGRQSRTSAAIDEDGDSAVGEHLQRLAAEHNRRNAAPPMGRHHDQVARLGIGDVNNRFVGMLVLDMHDLATYSRGGRGLLHLRQALRRYGRHALPI